MKLSLPDVTLVMTDTRCHELARLAVLDCMDQVDFGEVLVFSDRTLDLPGTTQHWVDDWPDKDKAQEFLWNDVPHFVLTSHFLFCEWDAWVIGPQHWRAEFLDYDYIGAPWDWLTEQELNIGNGGFSLRSTRMARYVAANPDEFPIIHPFSHDILLGRDYRPRLEKAGFRWPSEKIARRFAFETLHDNFDTFGFHGMPNWPMVISGDKLRERVSLARASAHIRKTQPIHLERLP